MTTPWYIPDEDPGPGRHAHRPAPRASRDKRIADEVVERLLRDERTRLQNIAVEVQNGVAILTGHVDVPQLMVVAGQVAWQATGVIDVCNVLKTSDGDDRARS